MTEQGLRFWSSTPAHKWDQGVVAGSGVIGAVVHGSPLRHTITWAHEEFFLPVNSRRPAPDLVPALGDLLFRETTTIGLRWRLENKIALAREFVVVETSWGKVNIKIARLPNGEAANAAPEFEDCRRIAADHAVPLKQVMEEAMRAYAATKEKC